jgi:hypothetical protein
LIVNNEVIDLSNREVLEDTALIVNEDVVNLINVDILEMD